MKLNSPTGLSLLTRQMYAENLATMIDPKGQQYALFKGVVDHRRDRTYIDDGGIQQPIASTLGWELCVQWAGGTSSWIRLADLRVSNPVEVAEYAISRHLDKEPAFRWWVRKTLRKRDRWVCQIKTRYWKRTNKYGDELPKSVKQSLPINSCGEMR
jgi:hypothetical protein